VAAFAALYATAMANINSGCTAGSFVWTPTSAATPLFLGITTTYAAGSGLSAPAGTATSSTCYTCSSASASLVSGTCITWATGCGAMSAASTCTSALSGYTLVSGTATLCSATTTSCTGGCSSGLQLVFNGSCITGT